MRRILCVAAMFLLCSLGVSSALAKAHLEKQDGPNVSGKTKGPHTVTWWCLDLNDLWNVDDPVVIALGVAVPPDPSPIPDTCTNPFPVTVPNGSRFVAGGAVIWFTNTTYPPAVRAALEEMGVNLHSNSPAEDFRSKMVEIRVEVRTFPDNELVAEFSFDPQRNFKVVRAREWFDPRPIDAIVDPALAIDISADEAGRLPLFGFPVTAGPVPPGQYRSWVYWTLSDDHNDGLGLAEENFFPAGEFLLAFPRFIVLP